MVGELYVGGPALLRALSLDLPPELRVASEHAAKAGRAAIYLADKQSVLAMLAVADVIRPESKAAIDAYAKTKAEAAPAAPAAE